MKLLNVMVFSALWTVAAMAGPAEAKTNFTAVHGRCVTMLAKFAKAKMVHSVFVTSDGLPPSSYHQGSWSCSSAARATVAEATAAALKHCEDDIAHFSARGYTFVRKCSVIQKF